jgi:hypothetical protein
MALEQVFAATPAVGDGGRIIASPFQFLFTGEDKLQLLIVNSAAGVTVQLSTRFLQAGTKAPQASAPTFTPTADRTVNAFDIPVGDGYLLNCSAIVVAGSPLVGQTYVMVRILRGASGATLMLGAMLGGYITAKQALAYPGSPIESSISGGGYPRTLAGTQPAFGAEVLETVPTGARWIVEAFTVPLISDATVVTRTPELLLQQPTAVIAIGVQNTGLAASLTGLFTWAPNLDLASFAGWVHFSAPIPHEMELLAGDQIKTLTFNLQPGDRFGVPRYRVREFLEAA